MGDANDFHDRNDSFIKVNVPRLSNHVTPVIRQTTEHTPLLAHSGAWQGIITQKDIHTHTQILFATGQAKPERKLVMAGARDPPKAFCPNIHRTKILKTIEA